MLEEWYALNGDNGLVFGREEGGYMTSSYITKSVLYPALDRAGVLVSASVAAPGTSIRFDTRSPGSRSRAAPRSSGCNGSWGTRRSR